MARGREYWTARLGEGWTEVLKPLLKDSYMENLMSKLQFEYAIHKIYPENHKEIFKAFKLCSWENLKVVVIGEEPGPFTGYGPLAFADTSDYINTSAWQIQHAISTEYGFDLCFDNSFEDWAKQGVLMLNRSLTAKDQMPKSHKELWKKFFGSILYTITKYKPGTVFMLWGKEAKKYAELLSTDHYVFIWDHPMSYLTKKENWTCPNFRDVDRILLDKYGRSISWQAF